MTLQTDSESLCFARNGAIGFETPFFSRYPEGFCVPVSLGGRKDAPIFGYIGFTKVDGVKDCWQISSLHQAGETLPHPAVSLTGVLWSHMARPLCDPID